MTTVSVANKTQVDNIETTVNAATSAATASAIAKRDSAGRLKVVDGAVASDVATKGQMDTAVAARIASTEKGAVNGVATLDSGGKVPQAQIPTIALTEFLGAVASQSAMLALTGQRGDWATRTDLGTDWQLIAEPSTSLASWRQMTYPASPVTSVAGKVGAVTLVPSDASAVEAVTAGLKMRVMTQAAYDALGTKDANTLYIIQG